MRICIELKKLNSAVIDLNHSYHIASLIYRCVQRSDPTLSLDLEVRIGSAEFSVSEVKVVREREIGRRGKFVTHP